MSNAFSWVFLAALAAATLTRLWLSRRQLSHVRAHRGAVPPTFAATIPLSAHQKAADYTVAKSKLGMLDALLDAVVVLGFTLGGGVQWLAAQWGKVLSPDSIWHGAALIVTVLVLQALIGLPLGLYRTFGIEQRFGFNRMTFRLFVVDLLKGLALAALRGRTLLVALGLGGAGRLLALHAAHHPDLHHAAVQQVLAARGCGAEGPRGGAPRALRLPLARPVRDGRLQALGA